MADNFLTYVNFFELQNEKQGNKAERVLRDLEGRAEFITKSTGEQPVSWYEFSRQIPQEEPQYAKNIFVGAGIGAAVIGTLGFMLAPPVGAGAAIAYALGSGAVLGGLVGGYHNTDVTSRAKQVAAYEQYLNQFEDAAKHSKGLGLQHDAIQDQLQRIGAHEGQFAQQLAEKRAEEKAHCGSCGKG